MKPELNIPGERGEAAVGPLIDLCSDTISQRGASSSPTPRARAAE